MCSRSRMPHDNHVDLHRQDIIDGVDFLLENKIGIEDKLAIIGHSFGGFSTLGGLAFTPDKFKVGFAGAQPGVFWSPGAAVAADGSEKSSPLVWQIDGDTLNWQAMPEMPTPVDDSVALVYQDRYIYLISGWHDVDNVDLVQVFDTQNQTWKQASAFPLPSVFGQAGAIVGNQMLVCDGVKVVYDENKRKQFLPSAECALGTINDHDATQIDWQSIPHYSGTAHYRMAATNNKHYGVFAGGSDNPYNYNGIGYDGVPSQASPDIRIYDFNSKTWQSFDQQLIPNMDHRGLLKTDDEFIILGGMKTDQELSPQIIKFNTKALVGEG